MAHCWEMRGCDKEMQSYCPHNIPNEQCPVECNFSHCDRLTHEPITAFDALLYPTTDRKAAHKEECLLCKFFLEHGPQITPEGSANH